MTALSIRKSDRGLSPLPGLHPQPLPANKPSAPYIPPGHAYERLGRLEEAVEIGVQTVELRKRALGHDDPDTLFSMYNLALTYERLGRLEEAAELGAQTVESRKRALGQDHPATLSSMDNLACSHLLKTGVAGGAGGAECADWRLEKKGPFSRLRGYLMERIETRICYQKGPSEV